MRQASLPLHHVRHSRDHPCGFVAPSRGFLEHYNLDTPNEVLRSIERAFAVSPTSKRTVEDILALPMVLDMIIEHKGTVVEGEALRHRRRLAKH